MIKKGLLRKYAQLIVKVGVNLQKGQSAVILAEADQHEFVTYVVDECYKAGAAEVRVEWSFQPITKLHYRHQSVKTLSHVPDWVEAKHKENADRLPCMIHILSEDPDGLNGINRSKLQKSQQARYQVLKPYRDAMENKYPWTIAAVPSAKWAKKVFPGCRTSTAIEKLYNAIFETVHITEQNDPIAAWGSHNQTFKERCDKLNALHLDRLTYKSANGTDFTVWLIPQAKWEGGGETTLSGHYFNPNMPTEEIFTAPMAGKAEGTLVATKPLSYYGEIIDDFAITFTNGEASSWTAKTGADALTKMIESDEGAKRLGEVALVPFNSPINNQNLLYYNTLFDENASCHFALGDGYTNLIQGYENMTKEELRDIGVNESMIHVDFMVGAADLTITGYTKENTAVPIFKQGNFCL
ncbi:MAG: aminopeptidase [Clostridiales bacterium]|nr:aminopeptidase [Clostridiales bacterium]